MELAIAMILIVIYTEIREYRWREHMKAMDAQYRGLRMSEHILARRVDGLEKAIDRATESVKAALAKSAEQAEFILKASTDLDTLLKEYEVNGIPLGLDRSGGKKAQFYEVGL